jgi:aminoglycoside phosphotransferase family enzyme/predicted kinase
MELSRLIECLSDPAAYPFAVDAVEVRQTHISAVFLAGQWVYKIKKPVAPGFLDFTTLEKRLHYCREEVRLNRRLAPDVYLGVVPIVPTPKGVRLEGDGEPLEWAVKMRRLPDNATLLERLRRDQVDTKLITEVAHRVAAFHRAAETSDRVAAFGRFEAVSRSVHDVFDRAAPHVGEIVARSVFDRLRALLSECLDHFQPLIESRALRGVTRDCHGDLRLDHVYHLSDREPPADLVIIDCIEFSEALRFIDPVADAAFLAMDLAFRGRRDLARMFRDAYFPASGDGEGRALLALYVAYRSAVRGMVNGLLFGEKEVPQAQRLAALGRARGHWLLALGELESPRRRPALVLVGGLPGTGKSTLARSLAEGAGCAAVRSDAVRKELAGLAPDEPSPPHLRDALYSAQSTQRTYAECLRRAEEHLFDGRRVIVDANFRKESQRQPFLDAAVRWGVPAVFLVCEAGPETVRERLAARRGDASDADWEVFSRLAGEWEEPGPEAGRVLRRVPTDGPPQGTLRQACEILRELGLLDGE